GPRKGFIIGPSEGSRRCVKIHVVLGLKGRLLEIQSKSHIGSLMGQSIIYKGLGSIH
ncbi:unnamed protein product, partial [Arabidopsis halleri]